MQIPPRPGAATPLPFGHADEERERLERLADVEARLHDTTVAVQDAEDQRETEFRRNEEHRDRIFLESQERRDQEARERAGAILEDLNMCLAALSLPEAGQRSSGCLAAC